MKMKSISLMTGVAVAALVFGAPGAFAQVAITQGTAVTPITNSAAVTGTAADSITTSGAISGLLSGFRLAGRLGRRQHVRRNDHWQYLDRPDDVQRRGRRQ